jgi:hypothetical protein
MTTALSDTPPAVMEESAATVLGPRPISGVRQAVFYQRAVYVCLGREDLKPVR